MLTMADAWREEGLQTGLQRGRQEGRQEATRSLLVRQRRRRFGELPSMIVARIEAADPMTLERLTEELLDARSLDELFPAL